MCYAKCTLEHQMTGWVGDDVRDLDLHVHAAALFGTAWGRSNHGGAHERGRAQYMLSLGSGVKTDGMYKPIDLRSRIICSIFRFKVVWDSRFDLLVHCFTKARYNFTLS